MEFIENLGISREMWEKNAPMVVGALGTLVVLVVGRLGIRWGWRGVKKACAWYKRPPAQPEPGTDAWIYAELAKLMTPEQNAHWQKDGTRYATVLADKTKVSIEHYGPFASVWLWSNGDGPLISRTVNDHRFRRAVKAFVTRMQNAESAAESSKFNEAAKTALQHVSATKSEEKAATDDADKYAWQLRLTRPGDTKTGGTIVNWPGRAMSTVEIIAWAYEMLTKEKTGSVIHAELTRTTPADPIPIPVPETVTTWVWEPAVSAMCLPVGVGLQCVPGALWSVDSSGNGATTLYRAVADYKYARQLPAGLWRRSVVLQSASGLYSVGNVVITG